MSIEVRIPELGESVHEVQVAQWLKQEGDWVERDEDLVEIESEKATFQLPSPEAGTLAAIVKPDGEFASVGDVIATIDETAQPAGRGRDEAQAAADGKEDAASASKADGQKPAPKGPRAGKAADGQREEAERGAATAVVTPSARRLLAEYDLQAEEVAASGPGGRLLKEDVLRHVEAPGKPPSPARPPEPKRPEVARPHSAQEEEAAPAPARQEEVVPMSMIRRAIATRLLEAQQQAALLTTFNEADMSGVMALRKKYQEVFQKKYAIKLGFMSFFVKAAVEALKRFPQVNAELRDKSVVYRNYYDVGIAIGGGKGLVVPVLRNCERMSFAEIEQAIADFGRRAPEGKITPEELEGGTFSITNGGIYGSLLSTPIVNPPQSGILGMHAIQERPVARDGQVVIRPMMYLALTYDHRLVDGREAVTFLRTIKELIEDPARLILEV